MLYTEAEVRRILEEVGRHTSSGGAGRQGPPEDEPWTEVHSNSSRKKGRATISNVLWQVEAKKRRIELELCWGCGELGHLQDVYEVGITYQRCYKVGHKAAECTVQPK